MERIVHLTSTHFPFDARVFHKECRTLAEAGFDTHLVVPYESDEIVDEVKVHGVQMPRNRLERFFRTSIAVVRAGASLNADLYHIHDPELLPFGALLEACGATVVYDAHEDLPANMKARSWIPRRIRGVVSSVVDKVELVLASRMSAIVAATPVIAERFKNLRPHVTQVQNFPVLSDLDQVSADLPYLERAPRIAYVGGLTAARGVRQMVKAVGKVETPVSPSFTIAGHFPSCDLEKEVTGMEGWRRVDFRGRVSQEEVFQILNGVRCGVAVMQPVPNYINAQPLKVFEYMAMGIPLVASDFPLWRRIIGEADCGLLVDPEKPNDIAGAIQWVLDHPEEAKLMGERGRVAVEEKYNWNTEADRLLALYDRLLS